MKMQQVSDNCFDTGLSPLDAAKRIEFGPYGEWRGPRRGCT